VPNHTNLLENNIHVSTETACLTGICDWKDTAIGPFGMSLGGLETMLGIRTMKERWRYHTNEQELRDLFWESFYQDMGKVSEEQKELTALKSRDCLACSWAMVSNGISWVQGSRQ
jgi:hypothetical protein